MTSILITGANRGIGLAMAQAAINRGMDVYGSARNRQSADAMKKALPRIRPVVFDVTDHEAIRQAAAGFFGQLDILVNNAGTIGPANANQTTLNTDFAGFRKTIEINTLAPLAISQIFLPRLRRSKKPRILTVSSQMSYMGYQNSDRIAYRASKTAVNKIMQGLATDLSREGIAVGLVDPGWVRTDMGGEEADLDPQTVGSGIIDLAVNFSQEMSGRFWVWNGEERDF